MALPLNRRSLAFVAVAVVSFGLGAGSQRYYDLLRPGRSTGTTAPVAAPGVDFAAEPLWAYGFTTVRQPGETAAPQAPPSRRFRPNEPADEQTRLRTVAGSEARYSLLDVRDNANVVDWFPGDHPSPMPGIIQRGPAGLGDRRWGCGSCHLPNGMGRPENAPAGGLPAGYILRQLQDFRSGLRRTADPRKPNTNTMAALARGMTEQEMREAADYFSAVPYVGRIRVVESGFVPPTRIVADVPPIAGRSASYIARQMWDMME